MSSFLFFISIVTGIAGPAFITMGIKNQSWKLAVIGVVFTFISYKAFTF